MKKLLILLVVLFGCLSAGCDGVMHTSRQRAHRGKMINDYQFRALVDDWDYFWLRERNTRLSEWHYRVGI